VRLHQDHRRDRPSVMADASDPIIRKTVSLPARLWREIENFQFESRLKKDVDAVRRLVEVGLKHWIKDLDGAPAVRIGPTDGTSFPVRVGRKERMMSRADWEKLPSWTGDYPLE
jgi:hypothetical protein